MEILILAPYPIGEAPSQRFRFEQYLPILRRENIEYKYVPFLSLATWSILHKPGNVLKKAIGVIAAFLNRFILILSVYKYDFVFIHREASHIGPPIFEWIIAKVFNKKIIYDFDDAIWMPNYSEHNKAFNKLKYYKKVNDIMKWSYKVSAGNAYLAKYASQYNPNVIINPTTIDAETHHNKIKNQHEGKVVIGWTGTLTTSKYLHELVPVIKELEKNYDFVFRVISNENPNLSLKSFEFVQWRKESEIEDLLSFHVGVMPLKADKWSEGKCGFKALQYMALGMPALVSPVGVNKDIVAHGRNGFICDTYTDWLLYLEKLINDAVLRSMLGKAARKTIEEKYSVKANTNTFLGLFDEKYLKENKKNEYLHTKKAL